MDRSCQKCSCFASDASECRRVMPHALHGWPKVKASDWCWAFAPRDKNPSPQPVVQPSKPAMSAYEKQVLDLLQRAIGGDEEEWKK